ncbi:hypothetical protein GE061_005712 [Apolygus lucorum]|uniref:Sulfhydryl oxidase n=1 Tax=Apolygus lucorum TaxID=248454 RepID=A0A8S9X112_APOLU|nr:hypothetical protein GE061_005712 [Apolygus lucorum]
MRISSILFVVAFCCSVGFGKVADLDPDEKAFLIAISMGRGLYYNYPHVVNLNASNFDSVAKGKSYSWVIEFYNSWCGHCLRFTPTYKRLANDLKDWNQVLRTGAVDCSNVKNLGICRQYEILVTPTLKYFDPNIDNNYIGVAIPREDDANRDTKTMKTSVHDLRNNITLELLRRSALVEIQPLTGDINSIEPRKPRVKFIVVVVECSPMIGPQLVLDYWNVKKVTVLPFRCFEPYLKLMKIDNLGGNGVYLMEVITIGPNHKRLSDPLTVISGNFRRSEALRTLHTIFTIEGIKVPKPFNMSSIKNISADLAIAFSQINKGRKPYHHTGEVFQVDIEGALDHSLTMEIPIHKNIAGKALTALINYLTVLYKYFPIGKGGKNFLLCVKKSVKVPADSVRGEDFSNSVDNCKKRHNPHYVEINNGWVGCHGTFMMFRGYPCSMWTMFHTLTVQAYQKKGKDPQEVLEAIKGYMKNFFGCTDCAQHFLKMAANMENQVHSLKDSVMYLWAAHNKANKRLHGDATEDPHFPKVQFPTTQICSKCHFKNGIFDKEEVFRFLHHMYTHINNKVTPTDLGFNTTYIGHKKSF